MPRTFAKSIVFSILLLCAATASFAQDDETQHTEHAADSLSSPLLLTSPFIDDQSSDDGSFEDRLSVLEMAWRDMQNAETEKKISSSEKPTLEIHGRIHLDHWSFTDDSPGIHSFENPITGIDPEDRFFFRRIRLRFQGEVFETMLYRMQIDFNSPDSGEMKDMYIGF